MKGRDWGRGIGKWGELKARLSAEVSPLTLWDITWGRDFGCEEPEGRIPSHWKLYWKVKARETVRNTITVAISNQMPDAAKA